MNKKRKTGFTLIELLVTILVLSLIVSIVIVTVNRVMNSVEVEKNKINITSINKAASQYTKEFKDEEKFWATESLSSDIEYACTTVGMLINKGILKEDILGIKILSDGVEKEIDRNTSIRVERDKNTKVYVGEVLFNNVSCGEIPEINVSFELSGSKNEGYSWYNNDVTIKINASNTTQISESYYTIKIGNSSERTINPSKSGENTSNWSIVVGEQGEEINVCVNIVDLNDNTKQHCLSEYDLEYNMDKERPSVPSLDFTSTKDIISKDSTDNLTSSGEIEYKLDFNGYTANNVGLINYNIDNSLLVNDRIMKVTVYDEAGNKNAISKTLSINSAQTATPSSNTTYYCDLHPSETYASQSSATTACKNVTNGTVSSNTKYTCSLDTSKTYSDSSTANSNCKKVGTVNSDTGYYCSLDGDFYISESDVSYCTTTRNIGYVTTKYIGDTCAGMTTGRLSYECSATPFICYSWKMYAEEACNPTTKEYSTKTYYYCNSNSNNRYFSQSDATSACTTTGTVNSKTDYYCSLNPSTIYTSQSTAQSNCVKTETGNTSSKTTYTCSITNTVYNNQSDAVSACTNYCENGDYYDNKCYYLR